MRYISVKQYGRYYNVECLKDETPKQALERAVKLKELGKPFSGPIEAKRNLPKKVIKKEVKEPEPPEKKEVKSTKKVTKKIRKKRTKNANPHTRG